MQKMNKAAIHQSDIYTRMAYVLYSFLIHLGCTEYIISRAVKFSYILTLFILILQSKVS